jgi:hypothetical protein
MPLRDLFLQHLVYQLVLLDHRQAFELRRFDFDRVHRAAAAADVLDLDIGSACHSHDVLCCRSNVTVDSIGSALSVYPFQLVGPNLTNCIPLVALYFVIDDVHLNNFAYTVRRHLQTSS